MTNLDGRDDGSDGGGKALLDVDFACVGDRDVCGIETAGTSRAAWDISRAAYAFFDFLGDAVLMSESRRSIDFEKALAEEYCYNLQGE